MKRSKVTVEPFTEDHYCCPPNIDRGPLNYKSNMKALGLVLPDKKIFENLFLPGDLHMPPTRTI